MPLVRTLPAWVSGQSPDQGHSPILVASVRRGGAPPHIRRRSRIANR